MTAGVIGRVPTLNDDHTDTILDLSVEGKTRAQAARALGVTTKVLNRWLKTRGLDDWFPTKLTQQQWRLEELRFHVDFGVPLSDIAPRLGLKGPSAGRNFLSRHDPELLARYDRLAP